MNSGNTYGNPFIVTKNDKKKSKRVILFTLTQRHFFATRFGACAHILNLCCMRCIVCTVVRTCTIRSIAVVFCNYIMCDDRHFCAVQT